MHPKTLLNLAADTVLLLSPVLADTINYNGGESSTPLSAGQAAMAAASPMEVVMATVGDAGSYRRSIRGSSGI